MVEEPDGMLWNNEAIIEVIKAQEHETNTLVNQLLEMAQVLILRFFSENSSASWSFDHMCALALAVHPPC